MACKKHREDIILFLYDELDPVGRESLESHLRECGGCRREMAYTSRVFGILDERADEAAPEPDWIHQWKAVRAGFHESPSRPKRETDAARSPFSRFPSWGWAAAALTAVFLLGWLFGRLEFFRPSPGPSAAGGPNPSASRLVLERHLEDIRPYLVEYSNFDPSDESGIPDSVLVDRELLRVLIVQNVLLRKVLAASDPAAARLLEDVDLVLRELANMEPGDSRTPALVRDLIEKRDILFQLEVLGKI